MAIDRVTTKRFDIIYSSDIQEIPFLFEKFRVFKVLWPLSLQQQYSLLDTIFPFKRTSLYL